MHGVKEGTRCRAASDRKASIPSGAGVVLCLAVVLVALAGLMLAPPVCAQTPGEEPPGLLPSAEEPLVGIVIEGNDTIQEQAIRQLIKTQVGRPPSAEQIRRDIDTLYRKRWFFNVEALYRPTDEGTVLVFKVLERPWVRNVEYRGNSQISDKHLAAQTGIKPGSPFDVASNRRAVERLIDFYKEKGFTLVKIELIEGGSRDDRDVVFEIEEGDKIRVSKIRFSGNDSFSSGILKTKTLTKTAVVGMIGGMYDPESLPNDIAAVKQYYQGLGYFDVKIEKEVTFGRPWWNPWIKNTTYADVHYKIDEGERFRVGNIQVVGNAVVPEAELREDLKITEGEYFNARYLEKDIAKIKEKYGTLGRTFAAVEARPVYLEEPGVVDLVLNIDEDRVYRIRRVDVVINGDYPHTKRSTVLNRLRIAPGDLADPNKLRKDEIRLAGEQIFERSGPNGPKITIKQVEASDSESLASTFRGQTSDVDQPYGSRRYAAAGRARVSGSQPAAPRSRSSLSQTGATAPQPKKTDDDEKADNAVVDYIFRGQSFGDGIPTPFNPMFESYDQGDPLYPSQQLPPGEVDVLVNVAEARTGRIMFGAGVNSDAGVVGQVVLTEENFDITRWPTSFQDIYDGTAFRGGGQRFRLEAVPGNVVSRYLVNWTDPYFLDTDYSLGFSGFYYNRFFPDWDEARTGLRATLGRQITPTISVNGAFRLEQVEISNPAVPAPVELTNALGTNLLTTFRAGVIHDTRDSAFLPGEGHRLEFNFEQAVGMYVYPRAELEGSQYFTLYSRPDGAGRHILSLSGHLGWTDSDTPIFERFYAGGFQTFRGFQFRGVTPRSLGVGIGGRWMALGTVEYMAPLLANEMVQGVVFSDFGTVENDVSLSEFRVAVGAGLRVTVPAMGPVPLAFDWSVPIVREDGDETRLFSFYVGINR